MKVLGPGTVYDSYPFWPRLGLSMGGDFVGNMCALRFGDAKCCYFIGNVWVLGLRAVYDSYPFWPRLGLPMGGGFVGNIRV